jgi:hypothetical protein
MLTLACPTIFGKRYEEQHSGGIPSTMNGVLNIALKLKLSI